MYRFTIEEHPHSEDVAVLAQGLTAHSLPHTGVPGFQSIASFMRDENGKLVGGVWGLPQLELVVREFRVAI